MGPCSPWPLRSRLVTAPSSQLTPGHGLADEHGGESPLDDGHSATDELFP